MTSRSSIAYISLGSNVGDPGENLEKGLKAIDETAGVNLLDRSPFYLTEPVDYLDQDWFVNAAAKIQTSLDPFELLKTLKMVEAGAGRTSSPIRFGPRVLDMDIIFYNNTIIDAPNLVIPHPRMHNRCFILQPLCDIDPAIVHPVLKQPVQTLLSNLNDPNQKVIPYPC